MKDLIPRAPGVPTLLLVLLPEGQAMEIGSAALTILVECWDGHLTPPEVASLADRASRARDSNMVRAAAELALSCLPHAHALNPNEIQRALVQCKEQVFLLSAVCAWGNSRSNIFPLKNVCVHGVGSVPQCVEVRAHSEFVLSFSVSLFLSSLTGLQCVSGE